VVKHGRENGTSGSQDGNMTTDFLLVFEQEFDIAVRLLEKHFLQLLECNQLAMTELLGIHCNIKTGLKQTLFTLELKYFLPWELSHCPYLRLMVFAGRPSAVLQTATKGGRWGCQKF
jgi:hypothetical protein